MDYIGLKCPVCSNTFAEGDDIVVCPECGTPHHRDCYDSADRCFYSERHNDDFTYNDIMKEEVEKENSNLTTCPVCNTVNRADAFFCRKCNSSLEQYTTPEAAEQKVYDKDNKTVNINGASFDIESTQFAFDPMGGIKSDDILADDITAGEMAKYVKTNTPYFLRIFKNIKNFSQSRFNFSAFLFSGGYFLYRKMYKIGTVAAIIFVALMLTQTYFSYTPEFQEIAKAMQSASYTETAQTLLKMPFEKQMFFIIPAVCEFVRYGLMFICGLTANRQYYKHCVKNISKIKLEASDKNTADMQLQTSGGVHTTLGIALMFVYLLLLYLPTILYML